MFILIMMMSTAANKAQHEPIQKRSSTCWEEVMKRLGTNYGSDVSREVENAAALTRGWRVIRKSKEKKEWKRQMNC